MKRRIFVLAPVVLGLLCAMVIGLQTAKADVNYDLNNDGIVDVEDMMYVAAAFGSHLNGPRWNSVADLDMNGEVNMRDIGLIAIHFGQVIILTFVVPEYPMGPILGMLGFFAALGIFSLIKPSKHDLHF